MKKIIIYTLVVLVAFFLLIQLIPFGRQHANPPVVLEPQWDSAQTRELAQRACFDCHSNETVWLWYSNVPPVSWLVQSDVNEGREKLNFSDWGRAREKDEIFEVNQEGEMPMPIYMIMHPEARFTSAEKDALIRGLQATINNQ
ncbi:MAG: heme-binding domain-containing protein [Anaerolineaceae bacterium]|nr:heme-binding domain-containing protein [Anaerolineaceae bacterium]